MKVLFLTVFAGISLTVSAQEENNTWAFGRNVGLDFNQNPPLIFQTGMESFEGGSVCFSDAAGNKMFYSNGNKVWDAGNNVMPNGNGILGNGSYPGSFPCSSAQGTVAAQSIANPNQYYLFTLDASENVMPSGLGKLRYSVIDMSLNGGLGDVVATQKNIVLEDSLSEKMVLIKGIGCNYWLLVHHVNMPTYYAFKIDAGGINPVPVASSGLLPGGIGIGMMAASPDGSMVTLSNFQSGLEIAGFNRSSGVVSSAGILSNHLSTLVSDCFSADNTKLYIRKGHSLMQYNAALFPDVVAMNATAVTITSSAFTLFGYMRRGPDNKIYIASAITNVIAVINEPNNPGIACNYALNGPALPTSAEFYNVSSPAQPYYTYGLGQDVLSMQTATATSSVKDTILCPGSSIVLSVDPGRDHYLWNNGNTGNTLGITEPGTYWVRSWQDCSMYTDTFHVRGLNTGAWGLGNDTAICEGTTLVLDASAPGITDFTWFDGSTAASYPVSKKGRYSVKVNIQGCILADTVLVDVVVPYVDILQRDTTICSGHILQLSAVAYPPGAYNWNNGATDSFTRVAAPGLYAVQATNKCGTYADSVTVNMIFCQCNSFVPNAFSPNADGDNDLFEVKMNCPVMATFQLSIFNRYGQRIFESGKPEKSWDGSFNGQPVDAGVYYYYLKYTNYKQESFMKKGDITLIR